jgi:hypothetical protein
MCVSEKVNKLSPRAVIITALDSQFFMEGIILTFKNF